MSNETFVSEAIVDSEEIILKEDSRGLVDCMHIFVCLRVINEHQHFKSDVFVESKFGEWKCSNH